MSDIEMIEANPEIAGGKPVIKGTRITVKLVLELLANGWSIDDIKEEYDLTEEQVRAAIKYAEHLAERVRAVRI